MFAEGNDINWTAAKKSYFFPQHYNSAISEQKK